MSTRPPALRQKSTMNPTQRDVLNQVWKLELYYNLGVIANTDRDCFLQLYELRKSLLLALTIRYQVQINLPQPDTDKIEPRSSWPVVCFNCNTTKSDTCLILLQVSLFLILLLVYFFQNVVLRKLGFVGLCSHLNHYIFFAKYQKERW